MNDPLSALITFRYEAGRLLGIAGFCGAALTVLALAFVLLLAPAWRDDAVNMRHRTARVTHDLEGKLLASRSTPRLEEQLRSFSGALPEFSQNVQDLRSLLEQARKAKVDLSKGEYRFIGTVNNGFIAYEVIFPVKASYAAVRAFIAGTLNTLPHASLIELRMERPNASGDLLDTRIGFTLAYRGGGNA